tara:strand:- start:1141 stop:1980 length:840 start_codon:yes stop_codon:yes gene_type:complete
MFSSYLYNNKMIIKKAYFIKGPVYLICLYLLKSNIDINIMYKLIYIFSLITGGTFFSTFIVSKYITNKYLLENKEENEEENTEYNKYIDFINNNYETFNKILNDELIKKKYTNDNKKIIESLKDKENHYKNELPYSHNDTIIIFYDNSIEGYLYYTKSDVNYKVLNAVCRNYVITKECINLFTDNEELKYIKNYDLKDNPDEDEIEIEAEQKEDEEENEEVSNGFVNIFYTKKKRKLLKNVKQNKFIYKGNINEYEKIYKINNDDIKNISYNNYKIKEI